MAEAIWVGAKAPGRHYVYEINEDRQLRAQELGLTVVSMTDLFQSASLIFLCIKPQNFLDLDVPNTDATPTIVSIMAGVTMARLTDKFPGYPLARVMPNTPCMVGEGMSAVTVSDTVTPNIAKWIQSIFKNTGEVATVPESWMDVVTGISGSGPAFLYRLCHSAITVGNTVGMPPEMAIQLLAQTMVGAGTMLQKSGKSPTQLVQEVTSPGGTTLAGLTEFDRHQIDRDFADVIQKAADRSKELSEL